MSTEQHIINERRSATSDTPRSRLKERLRRERGTLILDVVEEVLLEKGYHEMSMDEIAARAGVAKGTLYQHFPSKSDLIFALFERNLQAIEAVIVEVSATATTARAKLEAILAWVYREQSGTHGRVLQVLYSNEDIRRSLIDKKAQHRERSEQLIARLRAIVEVGKAGGEFDPALSTGLIITNFVYWLSMGRYRYEQFSSDEQLSSEQLVAQIGQLLFHGSAVTH